MVLLDPAGVTSGSREMKEKKKEAEKEGLKVVVGTPTKKNGKSYFGSGGRGRLNLFFLLNSSMNLEQLGYGQAGQPSSVVRCYS